MVAEFGTNSYGDPNSFTVRCNKCGKDAQIVATHCYKPETLELEEIVLELRCTCLNRFGGTIHTGKKRTENNLKKYEEPPINWGNFEFLKLDTKHGAMDFWFKTDAIANAYLSNKHMEQCMTGIPEVVYDKIDDMVGIKRIFPPNSDTIIVNDVKLHGILKELVSYLEQEV